MMGKAKTVNPATGEQVNEYERISISKAKEKIAMSAEVFALWKQTDLNERSTKMYALADLFEGKKEEYALLATTEMGKTIVQARKEIEKCAWICRFYAENAKNYLEKEIVDTEATKSYITFQPMGAVLAVMPWNFPF